MSSSDTITGSEQPVKVSRIELWRKSDLRTTRLFDAVYPGPLADEPAVSQSDEHVLVVELGQAPTSWPVSERIVWLGEWEPHRLLTHVVAAVKPLISVDPAVERVLTHETALDAAMMPVDLPLLYGTHGYGDDSIAYRLYKGVASTAIAVVWPGDDAVNWDLTEGTSRAEGTQDGVSTEYAYWSVLEAEWQLVTEDNRDAVHAVECLRLALAASCSDVPTALRAAVERVEGRLQATLNQLQPEKRAELPSITAPVLRTGATIAAVESRLSALATYVSGTSVGSTVDSALSDTRSLRAEARQLVDIIGSVFAARQLELAEQRASKEADSLKRDMTLQRYAASLGVVVLVPGLITGVFGANVALPYQDRAIGLGLMLLSAAAAACLGLGLVRWRFPAGAVSDDVRGPVPWVLYIFGALALLAAIALTVAAVSKGSSVLTRRLSGTSPPRVTDWRLRRVLPTASMRLCCENKRG